MLSWFHRWTHVRSACAGEIAKGRLAWRAAEVEPPPVTATNAIAMTQIAIKGDTLRIVRPTPSMALGQASTDVRHRVRPLQSAARPDARVCGNSVSDDLRLAFLGTATIYQDGRRFAVDATLFAEGGSPASSFFGHYQTATPDGLRSGGARIRFSDGSEADALLVAVQPDAGGFRISGYLESTEELRRLAKPS
jgi:hypothetical protein